MRRTERLFRVRLRVALALGVGALAVAAMVVPLGSAAPAATGPVATVSPTSLAFADQPVGTRSDAQAVTVTDTGDAPLAISTFHITGPDAADFGEGAICPVSPDTLAPGASCAIYVSFAPDSAGAKSATLEIGDNAADSPQTVALTGNGIAFTGTPAANLSPASLSFGDTVVGTRSDAQGVTIVNGGTAPLTISTVSITGADAADFSEGAACPVRPDYLAAGASCAIYVAFSPDSPGAKSATLEIGDDAPDGPQKVPLSGNGILGAGAVTLSPASLSFGQQLVGTRTDAQAVTLTNTGQGPLSISTFRVTGPDAADFAQGAACPVSPDVLAPGASCTIYVSFAPDSAGSKSATLAVGDDAADSPQTVALGGSGVSTPQVALSPPRLTFASTTVGTTSAQQTVTVSDTGGGPLHIASVGITGAGAAAFAQTNDCPATLAIGSSCHLTVAFTPSAEGSAVASLALADDGAGGGQTVPLFGAGVAPGTYFSDDFESGSLAQWDALSSDGSTISIDSTNAHSGTTSVRFTNSADNEYSRLSADLAGGGHAQTYTRFCFEIAPGLTGGIEIANGRAITSQYPEGIRRWEITYSPDTHGLAAYFFNESLDRLDLYAANGQVLPGEWHCVQLYLDESANGTAELWLDGAPVGSVTGDLSTPSPFSRIFLWNQPMAGTVSFDDVKVADAPIGG